MCVYMFSADVCETVKRLTATTYAEAEQMQAEVRT